MSYKLFLQTPDGARFEKQETESKSTAAKQFTDFLKRDDLDGTEVSLHLVHLRTTLAVHKFKADVGSENDWRNKLDQIEWPARGGQVGRPTELKEGGRRNVYLDTDSVKRALKLGKGNISEGIRVALAQAR